MQINLLILAPESDAEFSPVAFAAAAPKFPLGQIVITANARERLDPAAVQEGLGRHASGDWGDLPPEDAALNEASLAGEGRLFSAYGEGEGRFWIITECDRSATTILMPEDY